MDIARAHMDGLSTNVASKQCEDCALFIFTTSGAGPKRMQIYQMIGGSKKPFVQVSSNGCEPSRIAHRQPSEMQTRFQRWIVTGPFKHSKLDARRSYNNTSPIPAESAHQTHQISRDLEALLFLLLYHVLRIKINKQHIVHFSSKKHITVEP